MCGDYSQFLARQRLRKGSPLHVRGLLLRREKRVIPDRITPACAGTTRFIFDTSCSLGDHPCMCGDYSSLLLKLIDTGGSPLHVRGLLMLILVLKSVTGITPACAGTTWIKSIKKRKKRDHPCMCGDYT